MGRSVIKKPEERLGKGGRVAKEPPADALKVIEEAAQHGASMKGFAVALGVSVDTLRRWMTDYPELGHAIDTGREKERRILHDVVFQTAIAGKGKDSLLAAFMLLQNRHGYKEPEPDQANRLNIVFNMPGAMPLAEYIEVSNADGSAVQRVSTSPARVTRGD